MLPTGGASATSETTRRADGKSQRGRHTVGRASAMPGMCSAALCVAQISRSVASDEEGGDTVVRYIVLRSMAPRRAATALRRCAPSAKRLRGATDKCAETGRACSGQARSRAPRFDLEGASARPCGDVCVRGVATTRPGAATCARSRRADGRMLQQRAFRTARATSSKRKWRLLFIHCVPSHTHTVRTNSFTHTAPTLRSSITQAGRAHHARLPFNHRPPTARAPGEASCTHGPTSARQAAPNAPRRALGEGAH